MNKENIINIFNKYINQKVTSLSEITLGISNFNYKITTDYDCYIIRIPNPATADFFDRKNELNVINLIKDLDFDVPLVAFDQITGVKITKFIDSKPTEIVENLPRIAKIIKRIHQIPLSNNIKTIDLIGNYNFFILKSGENLDSLRELKLLNYIQKELENPSFLKLCHNDLVPNNFLSNDQKIYLIDYEYAGANHYFFDIASLISENDIDDCNQRLQFYQNYFTSVDQNLIDKINIWILFLDLYWHRWAQALYKVTKQEIFLTIANIKKERYLKNYEAYFQD